MSNGSQPTDKIATGDFQIPAQTLIELSQHKKHKPRVTDVINEHATFQLINVKVVVCHESSLVKAEHSTTRGRVSYVEVNNSTCLYNVKCGLTRQCTALAKCRFCNFVLIQDFTVRQECKIWV